MKISFWVILLLPASTIFAQSSNTDAVLIRQDTALLKPGKTIVDSIFRAVVQGKLRAVDYVTNQSIPPGQIYTWKMGTDTIVRADTSGNYAIVEVVQQYRKTERITQIRVLHDWYFSVTTGQFISRTRWIELLEEIYSPSGFFIGIKPFCKVYNP